MLIFRGVIVKLRFSLLLQVFCCFVVGAQIDRPNFLQGPRMHRWDDCIFTYPKDPQDPPMEGFEPV